MKRVLLTVLVVGLLATQASAAMFEIDHSTARQFTQQNTPNSQNQLYLVIDTPGTLGSTIRWQYDALWNNYGKTMQMDVGFVGQIGETQVMQVGIDAGLDGYDGLGLFIANDDDDSYGVRLYLEGATYTVPAFTSMAPGASTFLTLGGWTGTVTGFGFEVDLLDTGTDNFHISVVPVPAAFILGMLGLGAAGIRLRRFA